LLVFVDTDGVYRCALVPQHSSSAQMSFNVGFMRREYVDDSLKTFPFATWVFHVSIIGSSADNVK
jgi:hypothetical protein